MNRTSIASMLLNLPAPAIAAEIVRAAAEAVPAAVAAAGVVVVDATVVVGDAAAMEVTVAAMVAAAEAVTKRDQANLKGRDQSRGLFLALTIQCSRDCEIRSNRVRSNPQTFRSS